MPQVPRNVALMTKARDLRRNMTSQERRLWYEFLRDFPVKIYKQRAIDTYIADFYCASARLVIEVDGSQHFTPEGHAYDDIRTSVIERYGLLVIRFTNREVDTQFASVCEKIRLTIETRRGR